jgi:hypothetical protein
MRRRVTLALVAVAAAAAGAIRALDRLRGSQQKPLPDHGPTPASPPARDATVSALYEEAKQLGIAGRSRMNKAELQEAIERERSQ